MPADVNTFDMLRPDVLEGMTDAQLAGEVRRAVIMKDRVSEYTRLIMGVLRARLESGALP